MFLCCMVTCSHDPLSANHNKKKSYKKPGDEKVGQWFSGNKSNLTLTIK